MFLFYDYARFKLGQPSYSGHEVYPNAVYTDASNHSKRLIFKKNKYGDAHYSRLEVAFSKLAKLFLAQGMTTDQNLVLDAKQNVVGIGVEHLCYLIQNQAESNPFFYRLKNPDSDCTLELMRGGQAENIPFYFLDKLPHGYFAALLNAEKKKQLTLDYSSLASIFTSSYTLEEDDLHKGNFGFYITRKNEKPHVVFFKIDHDLMFVDSIMSFITKRYFHWAHDASAFDITANDLLNFPHLSKSSNGYWPAKYSYLANPFDGKDYFHRFEIEAFASLKHSEEFKKAKWLNFYKHTLISREAIESALETSFDSKKPSERAQIALISQSVVARQARLKAVLFSIQAFRDFVRTLSSEQLRWAEAETDQGQQIQVRVAQDQELLKCIDDGDTPLHIAIKMGDYRYEETLQSFGQYLNVKNKAGETPLDVALKMSRDVQDVRKDSYAIMNHLLNHHAEETEALNNSGLKPMLLHYHHQSDHEKKAKLANSYDQLKDILERIGCDHRFCLKEKKNLATACIKHFIEANQSNPSLYRVLVRLQKDINGYSSKEEQASLLYIRQLRSKLWIIRQIRGLYGWTSTQGEVNQIINKEIERLEPARAVSCCFAFFAKDVGSPEPSDTPNNPANRHDNKKIKSNHK